MAEERGFTTLCDTVSDDMEKRVKAAAKSLRKLERKIDEAENNSEKSNKAFCTALDQIKCIIEEGDKDTMKLAEGDEGQRKQLKSFRKLNLDLKDTILTGQTEVCGQSSLAYLKEEVVELLDRVTEHNYTGSDPTAKVTALWNKFNRTSTRASSEKIAKAQSAAEIVAAEVTCLAAYAARPVERSPSPPSSDHEASGYDGSSSTATVGPLDVEEEEEEASGDDSSSSTATLRPGGVEDEDELWTSGAGVATMTPAETSTEPGPSMFSIPMRVRRKVICTPVSSRALPLIRIGRVGVSDLE